MSPAVNKFFTLFAVVCFFCSPSAFCQKELLLDDFDNASGWKKIEAEQVSVNISSAQGFTGNCLKIDYDFIAGSGYGGIQKRFPLTLPDNYEFSFYIKADSPDNTLEFKLLDEEGTSVWWCNNRNYHFPKEWTKVVIKQRHISKAWGPNPNHKPVKIDKIEFIITSVNGGKGTVYFDNFCLQEKQPVRPITDKPVISASSTFSDKFRAEYAADKNASTCWKSEIGATTADLVIDLINESEFGGLALWQDSINYANKYDISISDDTINWNNVYTANKSKPGKSYIKLGECEARFIKIHLASPQTDCFSINEIEIKPVEFATDINNLFEAIANSKPEGFYPKYFKPQQSYFTVIGVDKDKKEALINEEGMIETDKSCFSIEPFIYSNGKLLTWINADITQTLEKNYLPIPEVNRNYTNLNLSVKSFADGVTDSSLLNVIYTIKNTSKLKQNGSFFVAIRPFQVNPPSQFLNTKGGCAKIDSINLKDRIIAVNDKLIIPISNSLFKLGAAEFDEGDITDFLSTNELPKNTTVHDHFSAASGAVKYEYALNPGEETNYYFVIPFYSTKVPNKISSLDINNNLQATIKSWENNTDILKLSLPPDADKLINTLRSSIAYILINRDGNGFQPGSRSYERSWIRDGAITSSALLKMGQFTQVKEYIEWYTKYQYPNGKVPCVVDSRGPDPVPENDSNGEFIYLLNQYFQFTKDTSFLSTKLNNIARAVSYMQSLISQTKKQEYLNNDSLKMFYGLLPESISHEGYSEKPMHSYWDDFWGIKGLKDAVEIATLLKQDSLANNWENTLNDFRKNFYNSMWLSVKYHNLDYIPGCADLGDFDATSTAIGLLPCGEKVNIPRPYLINTFNKYYDFFKNRRDYKNENWINYTPYEIRNAGAFCYMDLPNIAHELLDYFLKDQRPANWNHWAEVVWKDKDTPKFIGDMPHTWIASDFINVFRSFFAYENESDSSLVIGAGLKKEWIDYAPGISIENLNTYYGILNYSVIKSGSTYRLSITGNLKMPKTILEIRNFNEGKMPKHVFMNGKAISSFNNKIIRLNEFPANVSIEY